MIPRYCVKYIDYHEMLLMQEIGQAPVKVGSLFHHFRESYISTVVGLGISEASTEVADVPLFVFHYIKNPFSFN